MMEVLVKAWPDFDFLHAIESNNKLVAKTPPDSLKEDTKSCYELAGEAAGLLAATEVLRRELMREISGARPGSPAGIGPVAKSLQRQIDEANRALEANTAISQAQRCH